MAEEVELTEEFNVDETRQTTDWATYRQFINSLRGRLGERFSHNRPVLPPQQNPPSRWFHIILRTESHTITLRIRRDNLYLDGYQMEDGQWLEFRSGSSQLIPGSTFLPFDGGYNDLQRVARVDMDSLNLSQNQLTTAVNQLAVSSNDQERARYLIVVIQMICESIRFERISNHLAATFRDSLPPPNWMLALEHGWEDVSAALLRQDADPDYGFRLPQPNDMGIQIAEQVANDIGIMLGLCFGPSGISARFPRMASEYHGQCSVEGRPMVEVFSVRINNIDGENPGDLYGTIAVSDGLGSQYIYNRERDQYQSIYPGDNASLTGPSLRAISAYGDFTISLALMDKDADLSPDDEISNGQISWNVFHTNNVYDQILTEEVPGKYGLATVYYAVFSNAVQATIEVKLINGDGEDPADVYGRITARSSNNNNESTLFDWTSDDYKQVRPQDLIPLSRSIVAVPFDSELIVRAKLYDYDTLSSDDEIANGIAEFPARTSGIFYKSIYGEYGEVQVKVTWYV